MSEADNVMKLPGRPKPAPEAPQVDPDVLVNLMNFCTRIEEGMRLTTAALVAMESRLKRLELAHSKAERAKAGALLDARGERLK